MSRQVVVVLRQLRETHRFVRGIVSWIGFKQRAVLYDRPARAAGETKYPLRRLVRFAIDGITSFSIVPLRFATYLGMVISVFAVCYAIWAIIAHLVLKETVQGWTATIVLVALFASAQLLMTGILGEYIGRIYEQVKLRPLYVVAERLNLPEERDTDELDAVDAREALPALPRHEVAVALESRARPHLAPPTPVPLTAAPAPSPKGGSPLGRPATLLGVAPQTTAAAPFPGTPVGAAPDVPPPPPFTTAPMRTIPKMASKPPPVPKKSEPPKPGR
jgi:dolichol-phosphate mannosyltransferase